VFEGRRKKKRKREFSLKDQGDVGIAQTSGRFGERRREEDGSTATKRTKKM